MEPGGATLITGIFGEPVEHSLSPAMHNAAYRALAMDRVYLPFHVRDADLPSALRSITALNLLGVNVTVPHKQRIAGLLRRSAGGRLSREAAALGSVNCVINRRGKLYGDNTDARGLEIDLRELGALSQDRTAVVIGAGGSAPAALAALGRLDARRIVLANRTEARARALARRFGRMRVEPFGLGILQDENVMSQAALVINATSASLAGAELRIDYRKCPADCLFYDLMYAPAPSPFMSGALAGGFKAVDGAGMLLHQGALAFKLFNGVEAPLAAMRRALFEALGR